MVCKFVIVILFVRRATAFVDIVLMSFVFVLFVVVMSVLIECLMCILILVLDLFMCCVIIVLNSLFVTAIRDLAFVRSNLYGNLYNMCNFVKFKMMFLLKFGDLIFFSVVLVNSFINCLFLLFKMFMCIFDLVFRL